MLELFDTGVRFTLDWFVTTSIPVLAYIAYISLAVLLWQGFSGKDEPDFIFIVHLVSNVVFILSLDQFHWVSRLLMIVLFYALLIGICDWVRFVRKRTKENV